MTTIPAVTTVDARAGTIPAASTSILPIIGTSKV